MSKRFLTHIDLAKNELQNVALQNLATDPSTPVKGQAYFNTSTNRQRNYNGTTWDEMGTGAATGDVSSNTAVSVDSELVIFNGTTGKAVKRATTTGILKGAAGVLSAAASGTDYSAGTSALATGIVKTTTTTGALTIAVAADFPTLNQSTTGTANNVTGTVAVANGGTGAITLTGLVKGTGTTAFVAAIAGTDYLTGSSTNTLTNKAFDANGTGNGIINLETADLASGVLNTTGTLTGATDAQIPSALAAKTYADSLLGANDAMVYKGAIDASLNPNYVAASAGHTYKISVAGKVGGVSGVAVTVGDTIICTVDGSAAGDQATVGANWTIVQANVDRATNTTLGLAEYATAAEAEARTDSTVAVTPVSLASFPVKKIFTIGDAVATTITLTHNLGTQDVITQLRQAADNAVVEADVVNTSTSAVTVTFAVAPALNAIKAVVMG